MNNNVKQKRKLPEPVREQIAAFTNTNPFVSAGTAIIFFAILIADAAVFAKIQAAYLFPLLALLSVRSLRALENLGGHEGAHVNWLRSHPRINDLLANCFAGSWVFTSAQAFRKTHTMHHRDFGAPPDPCFARFSMFRFAQMRSGGIRRFFGALVREYFPYLSEYWTDYIGVKRGQLAISISLHLSLMVIGNWLMTSFWIGWIMVVLIPFFFISPVFRMWAEAEEHDYDGKPEFLDTYNNLSLFSRWFLHPAGDAFHLLHHTIPSVPHFRMPSVHKEMLEIDPGYRSAEKVRY